MFKIMGTAWHDSFDLISGDCCGAGGRFELAGSFFVGSFVRPTLGLLNVCGFAMASQVLVAHALCMTHECRGGACFPLAARRPPLIGASARSSLVRPSVHA